MKTKWRYFISHVFNALKNCRFETFTDQTQCRFYVKPFRHNFGNLIVYLQTTLMWSLIRSEVYRYFAG